LEEVTSNGINAYIDPGLQNFLKSFGAIYLDFINQGPGRTGFSIRVGNTSCGDSEGGCSSCG